ncbi:DUF262 domain-containing protein [Pandoraea sputorum]|uniref:DUF262 domain-containing protein n=1 Tax=Pandoraea sputorum TaxID=93222 RepID=UPI002AF6B48B|nr:DUF262 domain-containing protein [Pandoraea sputorum]
MNLIEAVEKERHHVVVDTFTPTWNELLAQFRVGDVEIDPAYQRAFRWSYDQQTTYIESLLLNIPTPPVFLAEKPNGAFEVIDGLQRFSTMVKFFAAEIFPEKKSAGSSDESDMNEVSVPSILSDAPILQGLNGLTRETLPDTLVRTLRYARVQVILLKKESSPLARYNVFTRLNRAGTTLSNQEIRNCSARLFGSTFPDRLNAIGQNISVRHALGLSTKEASSMGYQENILRLIAFGNFSPETKSIEDFLDAVMYNAASGEFDFSDEMERKLISTFELIADTYPHGEAFKFFRNGKFQGGFSPNLFDIVACGIYKNFAKCKKKGSEFVRNRIFELHSQKDALALTGAGSNTKAKMVGRVAFGKRWFA